MVNLNSILTMSILIMSLLIGVISFYLVSDLPKEQRKKQTEDIITQITNFVIFIWVSKIILNISQFLRDPLSILAYPSDSKAFYLAVLLHATLLLYKSKRGQNSLPVFIKSFIPVFLVGTFVYEFFQYTLNNSKLSIGSMVLHAVLVVLYLYLQDKKTFNWLITIMLSSWTIGYVILSIFQPFVTIFGYLITPWFLLVFFVVGLTMNILNHRKEGL